MTPSSAIDVLGSAKYISLTTFRKDGTGVATPVWLARDGDHLVVITDPASGKAKRLRNNPSVLISPCDMRGRVKPGAISVPASVTLQDEAQTRRSMEIIAAKYGLMGRLFTWMNERRARKAGTGTPGHLGLTIMVDPQA